LWKPKSRALLIEAIQFASTSPFSELKAVSAAIDFLVASNALFRSLVCNDFKEQSQTQYGAGHTQMSKN
jgi:hypothetical protein